MHFSRIQLISRISRKGMLVMVALICLLTTTGTASHAFAQSDSRTGKLFKASQGSQATPCCVYIPWLKEYPLPTGSEPPGITAGPDGNVWFTEYWGNKIGRITPSGSLTEYAIPTSSSYPVGITAGPDGNVWFTELSGNQIGSIDTYYGSITEYSVPTFNSEPWGITTGPDGNVWFTEYKAGKIAHTYVQTVCNRNHECNDVTRIREYSLPVANSYPQGITAGPDGNLWFAEAGSNLIGRMTPSGSLTEFSLPSSPYFRFPQYITAGPDGNLWFTEQSANGLGIGRMTPSGSLTEFSLPTATSGPDGITAGPDGNLWFTEWNSNLIGRITPTGSLTEYAIPTANSQPEGITAGPDGNIWFTEFNGNKVAILCVSSPTNCQ